MKRIVKCNLCGRVIHANNLSDLHVQQSLHTRDVHPEILAQVSVFKKMESDAHSKRMDIFKKMWGKGVSNG